MPRVCVAHHPKFLLGRRDEATSGHGIVKRSLHATEVGLTTGEMPEQLYSLMDVHPIACDGMAALGFRCLDEFGLKRRVNDVRNPLCW